MRSTRRRRTGRAQNIGRGIGEGRLVFDFAVLGASSGPDYELINGLRSEVEGLGTWVGLRSLNAEQESEDGRLTSVNLRLESSPSIRVGRLLNATLQPNWRYGPGPGPDQTTITERMQICTKVKKVESWDTHLRAHLALRDLLRVASWRRLNFASHEAMSLKDPLRALDGSPHGVQWHPVITQLTGLAGNAAELNWMDFLFSFGDVGSRGVGRWLDVTAKLKYGVTPLVGLLELEGASLEGHLAQVGIGYEMLGHGLLIESGASKTKARKVNFVGQVRAVSSVVAGVLPFDVDGFPKLLSRMYNGVKHADRERPGPDEMYLAYQQATQIFRAWVALRLGMPEQKLKAALEDDKVTRHIRELQRLASSSSTSPRSG